MVEVAVRAERARERDTFAGFDGLRAIAALSVTFTHATYLSGFNGRSDFWGPYAARLDIGVAVFFLISGFLLYRPFVLARMSNRARPDTRSYLWRRFLRIYPAYWVAFTLIVFVLPRVDTSVPSATGLLAHYSLVHIYFTKHAIGPMKQSWTLATEVSFYVFLPLWAGLMGRWRGTRGQRLAHELAGAVALYLVSVVFRVLIVTQHWEPAGVYKLWLPARLDLFAWGMGLAAVSAWFAAGQRPYPRWLLHKAMPWVSWGLAAVTLEVASKHIGLESHAARNTIALSNAQDGALEALWGLFAFFLLVPIVFAPNRHLDPGAIRRFLSTRVMAWLGLVSYGIYLWHEEALDVFLRWTGRDGPLQNYIPSSAVHWHYPLGLQANFVEMLGFMLLFTIPVAALSFYLVERPTLRLKGKLPYQR